MDLGLHGTINWTLSRWFKMPAWAMFFAFLGGMAPDIWSHIPNIHTVFDREEVTYAWYHFPHSWTGVAVVWLAIGCLSGAAVVAIESINAQRTVFLSAIWLAIGFTLHVAVDQIWHRPGGGWQPWGFWANVGGWVLMLWANLPWAIRTIKKLFSKNEGTSHG